MNRETLDIVMRYLHIFGAIVALGGSIFARFVLMPSMAGVPEAARADLHEQVRRRFARLFMFAVAALLVSGFYNYVVVQFPRHPGQPTYHGLMGLKIGLAFVVFFIGSALVGRSPTFEGLRRKRSTWLGFNILLAMTIVAIAGVLRAIPAAN